MDRIDRIGPSPPQWQPVALEPDREDVAERRRREQRRRQEQQRRVAEGEQSPPEDDPPHRIDVRA